MGPSWTWSLDCVFADGCKARIMCLPQDCTGCCCCRYAKSASPRSDQKTLELINVLLLTDYMFDNEAPVVGLCDDVV
ncbi:hypothetical protein vseg_000087 [Gypsophila vaccaria]